METQKIVDAIVTALTDAVVTKLEVRFSQIESAILEVQKSHGIAALDDKFTENVSHILEIAEWFKPMVIAAVGNELEDVVDSSLADIDIVQKVRDEVDGYNIEKKITEALDECSYVNEEQAREIAEEVLNNATFDVSVS